MLEELSEGVFLPFQGCSRSAANSSIRPWLFLNGTAPEYISGGCNGHYANIYPWHHVPSSPVKGHEVLSCPTLLQVFLNPLPSVSGGTNEGTCAQTRSHARRLP